MFAFKAAILKTIIFVTICSFGTIVVAENVLACWYNERYKCVYNRLKECHEACIKTVSCMGSETSFNCLVAIAKCDNRCRETTCRLAYECEAYATANCSKRPKRPKAYGMACKVPASLYEPTDEKPEVPKGNLPKSYAKKIIKQWNDYIFRGKKPSIEGMEDEARKIKEANQQEKNAKTAKEKRLKDEAALKEQERIERLMRRAEKKKRGRCDNGSFWHRQCQQCFKNKFRGRVSCPGY